jgi:hypothetical protein
MYSDLLYSYKFIGNDIIVKSQFKQFVETMQRVMFRFLSEGFDSNDPDVTKITEYYDNLENIKKQL